MTHSQETSNLHMHLVESRLAQETCTSDMVSVCSFSVRETLGQVAKIERSDWLAALVVKISCTKTCMNLHLNFIQKACASCLFVCHQPKDGQQSPCLLLSLCFS